MLLIPSGSIFSFLVLFIHTYIHTYSKTLELHAYTHTHTHARTYICKQQNTTAYIHKHTHTHTHIHTYIHIVTRNAAYRVHNAQAVCPRAPTSRKRSHVSLGLANMHGLLRCQRYLLYVYVCMYVLGASHACSVLQ